MEKGVRKPDIEAGSKEDVGVPEPLLAAVTCSDNDRLKVAEVYPSARPPSMDPEGPGLTSAPKPLLLVVPV